MESIDGVVLKDREPRKILGVIIADAKAKDGAFPIRIQDGGDEPFGKNGGWRRDCLGWSLLKRIEFEAGKACR